MNIKTATIVDTYPDFLKYWSNVCKKGLDEQIDKWESVYMSKYPELLQKQLADYANLKANWRKVAYDRIFPFLPDWLLTMEKAHKNLKKACKVVFKDAQNKLGFDEVIFVLYVGIGCGAGWATTYAGTSAVLLGLEKIAECKWYALPSLHGLIAHELGHVIHFHLRKKKHVSNGKGAFWNLYTEGFAQRCEHLILGKDTWHEARGINDKNWLAWCCKNKGWLAKHFLTLAKRGKPVNRFFGDWLNIKGKKQCGYYLGHEIIKLLEKQYSLNDIALFDDIDVRFGKILKDITLH
jgi:hypothetical protein